MARTVKHDEHAVKRNDILDAAQKLIYTKGYEQMSVQDMLAQLKISKGAFYHYFDSKQALLEALIERMGQEAEQLLTPLVQDPHLSGLQKLKTFVATSSRWKAEYKDYLMALIRVWYADENALVRQKMTALTVKRITPLLTEIVRQGVREGVFTTPHPDHAADVIYALILGLGDTFGHMILEHAAATDAQMTRAIFNRAKKMTAAYSDALERVLGAPRGSLELVDSKSLKVWLPPHPQPQEATHVANDGNGKRH
jgi:AcrR family transcriptional regulator